MAWILYFRLTQYIILTTQIDNNNTTQKLYATDKNRFKILILV